MPSMPALCAPICRPNVSQGGQVKELSIEGLAQCIDTGETVFLAGAAGEPLELTAYLADDRSTVADATYLTSFVPGINARCLARSGRRSRIACVFMQPSLYRAHTEGRVDFRPMSYFGVQRWLSSEECPIDSAFVQVAPPNRAGNCSLGPAVEFMPTVIARAQRLFGIINPSVPRLRGAPSLPIEQFTAIAHSTAPLASYDVGATSAASARVVEHLAGLIPSHITLQIGLGKIPSQLLQSLARHRGISMHTGMISDAVLQLAAAGALRRRAPICTGAALGTIGFYSHLATLRGLKMAPVAVTHSPMELAKIERLFAVNSALEVDLLGQVNAEVLDGRYVSGPGGLPDFARAAHLSAAGLSIIALNATDQRGATSRIVARLAAGVPVTIPQHDVDAVVTEYGVAMLRGQTIDERARRLCAIAHPDHRAALVDSIRRLDA
jgi:acyl-CoA hydrolase